jgi:hypothetical protein
MLSQVVEDSMAELLRQRAPSPLPDSDAGSAHSQESQFNHSYNAEMTPSIERGREDSTDSACQNEAPPSLLDLDLDVTDFNINTLQAVNLRNRPMDDSRNCPNPFAWSEIPPMQSIKGDVTRSSEWDLEHAGKSVADFTFDAAETSHDDHRATCVLQLPDTFPPSELFSSESSSHITVIPPSRSMDPPRVPTMQYTREPTMVAQPLQQKRSQRSLDSGYGSVFTAQQNSSSENNSTETLSYLRTGIHDTLAEVWGPVGAAEEAFVNKRGVRANLHMPPNFSLGLLATRLWLIEGQFCDRVT